MDLINCLDHIDGKIVKRGVNYYQEQRVYDVHEQSQGYFVAKVQGNDTYCVEVAIGTQDMITSTSCNCPYSYGDICKHEVALLVFLQNAAKYEELGKNQKAYIISTLGDPQQIYAEESLIKEYVETCTREELANLFVESLYNQEQIKSKLLLAYIKATENKEHKKIYILRARRIIRKARYTHPIGVSAGSRAATGYYVAAACSSILAEAKIVQASGDVKLCLELLQIIMEEITSIIERIEDRAGIFVQIIVEVLEIMQTEI